MSEGDYGVSCVLNLRFVLPECNPLFPPSGPPPMQLPRGPCPLGSLAHCALSKPSRRPCKKHYPLCTETYSASLRQTQSNTQMDQRMVAKPPLTMQTKLSLLLLIVYFRWCHNDFIFCIILALPTPLPVPVLKSPVSFNKTLNFFPVS